MWKVTYAVDSLDTQPDEAEFETEWEAIEFATEEMARRVDFQVQHSPYSMSEKEVRELEELESQLVRITHLV